MSFTNSNSSKYRADIDGLRAIAVLSVIFFHADIGFPGGFVGVDVFFVISGYLITGLILKELDGGQFQVLEFWERRVRRILPALTIVVLTSLIAGWFLFLPLEFKGLGQSAVAQAMLLSNVYFWQKSDYFAPAAEMKPLLHTWSLAVEEQFYLFFPLLLIAINRFSRKSLIPAILLLCGVSFSLSVYCSYRHFSANFYLLPTRAWELLIGSFIAAIPTRRASVRWLSESLSWGGLLAILCAVFFYDHDTRFPGVAAILPCVGTALVIWANGHTLTSVGKLLTARPIVFIGLISYSLYLWHWPVFVFSKYPMLEPIPQAKRILLLLASMLLAVLTWRFVETPFRKRMLLKSRAQIFTFASITTAALLLAGLAVYKMHGFPSRIPADALRYANGATNHAFINELGLKDALNENFIEIGTGDKLLPIDLLVWGDSHAMAAMSALDSLCKEHSIRGVAATHSGAAPLVGYEGKYDCSLKEDTIPFNSAVVEFIRRKRVGNVVLIARWELYIKADKGTERLRSGVLAMVDALLDSGAKIWIMRQVPKHHWDVPSSLTATVLRGGDPEELGLPLSEHLNELENQNPIFEGIAGKLPTVTILDPTELFLTSNNLCRVAMGGEALYYDYNHLTVAGAMVLRPLFDPIFRGISRNREPTKKNVSR